MVRSRQKSVLSCFVFLLLIICAGSAWAVEHGTILTKSGDSYADVDYTVNRSYRVIEIQQDSGKKNVSFDQVKIILDADGKDVTEMVLEDYYKPTKEETWKSETSPAVAKYKAKKWNVGFRVAPTYNTAFGDYYEGINGGIGLEGSFLIAATNQIDIKFTYTRTGLEIDEDYINDFIHTYFPGYDTFDSYDLNASRILVSVLYHHRMMDLVPGRTYPYAETGLGAMNHSFKFDNFTDSETKFMWTVGGGAWVMISKNIALDFSGSFDFIVAGTVENSIGIREVVYGYLFNLNAGLAFFL